MIRRSPKIIHWKKPFKQKITNDSKIGLTGGAIRYCTFGIKSLGACKVQYAQIEAIRRILAPFCKKKAKIFFFINFSVPLTAKSAAARMGKGKGKVSHYVANIRVGQMLLEFDNFFDWQVRFLFQKIKGKLPVPSCLIKKLA